MCEVFRMKKVVTLLCLLLVCSAASAQINKGRVYFKWQNSPSPQFKFDLDRGIIAQVMENPNAEITSLYSTLDNIYLRSYHMKGLNYEQMQKYYRDRLTTRGWNRYQQDDSLVLFTLRQDDFVAGIFVIVNSGNEVYLINILGKIPPKQVTEILRNLNQLGIDLLVLNNLRQIPDSAVTPPTKPIEPSNKNLTIEPIIPEGSITQKENLKLVIVESQKSPLGSSWRYAGLPIDNFIIQNQQATESYEIFRFLENGSGDLENVLPIVIKALRKHRNINVRIAEEHGNNIAILTVVNRKRPKSVSVLRSLTITNTGATGRIKATTSNLEIDEVFPHAATRFRAADAPIHELRIVGNQKIHEEDIRKTLNNGSENIENGLKTLFKVMPFFKEIKLQVKEENYSRVATVTVEEKRLSSTAYLGMRPPIFLGFNRVNDWEFGTGFQIGKPITVGPLWMWNVEDSLNTRTSNIYGRISYSIGNPQFHYRFGGRVNWGKPYIWNIGLTAQIHRQTDAIAPELFPNFNDGISTFQRVLGFPDLQNYYLRQGVEVGLRWSPLMPTHSFKLGLVAESHESLQKSTDWQMLQWVAKDMKSRGNPAINQGKMRSLTFQYDFNTRLDYLGWHNTLLVEHSNTSMESDFDFTRVQLHLRYAFPLDNNRLRTRLFFGYADKSLPMQRQFAISGLGGLRGYPLYVPANDIEREADKKPWYGYSQYAFMGDRGFLLNVEFHYRMLNLTQWNFFKNAFLVFFIDEGQVWNVVDGVFYFDPKADIGIGLQFGEAGTFRLNLTKTLDSWKGYQSSFGWYHSF